MWVWGLAGTKCAHAIAGTEEDLSAKEFRSFGTLNAIWGSLIKAVVGVPPAIVRALIDLERQSLEDMGKFLQCGQPFYSCAPISQIHIILSGSDDCGLLLSRWTLLQQPRQFSNGKYPF